MNEPERVLASGRGLDGPLDLTGCDREPIHIPGAIQPHGLLLALRGPSLAMVEVSANVRERLGVAAGELLGRDLGELLDPDSRAAVDRALAHEDPRTVSPLRLRTREAYAGWPAEGILHRAGDLVVLELEPAQGPVSPDLYPTVRGMFARMQRTGGVVDLCQRATDELARLTGFDRVMAYRFDRDDHGQVIAETRRPDLEPYLDLHYPASDIPAQARRLYTINWLRLIVDVAYEPTPLVALAPGAPLDLSQSVLRSVSPIHVQYLKNMRVQASMSVSLVVEGRLWGLLMCHHDRPRLVPYEVRSACELLAQALSWQVATRERAEACEHQAAAQTAFARLIDRLAATSDPASELVVDPPALLGLVDAQGAAVRVNGAWTRLGQTPDAADLDRLAPVLIARQRDGVLASESLVELTDEAGRYQEVASGALAIDLAPGGDDLVVWFRPEVVQTVNWAGDPRKVTAVAQGPATLSPRGSFALWREIVRARARPWQPWQLEVAADLRRALLGRALRRHAELLGLNARLSSLTTELAQARDDLERRVAERTAALAVARDDLARHADDLARSNEDLERFAYVASHDLQEPLRMVLSYVQLLARRYRGKLDADADEFIAFAVDGATRMQSLISDLLAYSQIGRNRRPLAPVDLEEVLGRTLTNLSAAIAESGAVVTHDPLPRVAGHPSQLGQLLQNLIGNALKFHGPEAPRVHVGAERHDDGWTIRVSDQGIGIAPEHLERIFVIFQRLNPRSEYPGSGVGLAISKKIVDNHGGTLRVASTPGHGTTFSFTLPDPRETPTP